MTHLTQFHRPYHQAQLLYVDHPWCTPYLRHRDLQFDFADVSCTHLYWYPQVPQSIFLQGEVLQLHLTYKSVDTITEMQEYKT